MSDAFMPVVDLGLVKQGRIEEVGHALRDAFVGSGFCYVRNHGVPEGVISAARESALEFFRLPLEEKLKAKPKQSIRGFNAIGRTTMQYAEAPDYKEFFQIGLDLSADDPDVVAGQPLRGPNQWPEGRPQFRDAFSTYFDEIASCGQTLLSAVAVSLGISPTFFEDKYRKPLQRTQAVYYPPHPTDHSGELYGVAPHTDYGCVTLLWQDDVGGLEVLHRSGEWVSATPIPGTLVINIGDLLHRWSNDRYLSSPHRVTNRSGRERLSIATFYDPDFTAVVDPRDLEIPSGDVSRHVPVSAGDYIMGRINASQV
jgi:isopenicillin N synthase-like dioxygenase